jgi:hypothetical protein
MSLVDRWLSRSPQDERVATSATSPENPCISADFSVATNLRHAATSPRAPSSSPPISQPVAAGLRNENLENSAAFEAMSHMSQMSQGSITKVAKPAEPIWWREFYEERAEHRELNGRHPRAEAERLAWCEAQWRWHKAYGERVSRDLCAGCRRPIGEAEALDLIDGSRVHIAEESGCLLRHGERWRRAATRALVELGLQPPESFLVRRRGTLARQ